MKSRGRLEFKCLEGYLKPGIKQLDQIDCSVNLTLSHVSGWTA